MSKTLEYFISTPHWLDALTSPLQQHLDRLADTTQMILEQAGVTLAAPPGAQTASSAAASAPPITSSEDIVRGIGRWITGGVDAPTLSQVFLPSSDRVANAALIGTAVVAMVLLAQIKIGPVWLQPLAILLAGAVLGSKNGVLATISYIALGVIGLPVFGLGSSAWTDLSYQAPYAQHALGYLAGMVLTAFVVGWLAERRSWDRRIPTAAALAVIGVATLYIPGRIWVEAIALFLRQHTSQVGVLPSIPMLLVTAGVLTVGLPWTWSWVAKRRLIQPGPRSNPLVSPAGAVESDVLEPEVRV
jgi:biotin transport system substrate-specific component